LCCCGDDSDKDKGDKYDDSQSYSETNKQKSINQAQGYDNQAYQRNIQLTNAETMTDNKTKQQVRINSKASEMNDERYGHDGPKTRPRYPSNQNQNTKPLKSNLKSSTSTTSDTSSSSNTSLIKNLIANKKAQNQSSQGYNNESYVDFNNLTLTGGKLEVDQETYASSIEVRENKARRWVNPGQTREARIKAKKSPYIEYDRTINNDRKDLYNETTSSTTSTNTNPTKNNFVFNNTSLNYPDLIIETARTENNPKPITVKRKPNNSHQNQTFGPDNNLKLRPGMVPSIGPQFTVIEEGKVMMQDHYAKDKKPYRYSQKNPSNLFSKNPSKNSKIHFEEDTASENSINLSDLTEAKVDTSVTQSVRSSFNNPMNKNFPPYQRRNISPLVEQVTVKDTNLM